jgi:hypothetical protein
MAKTFAAVLGSTLRTTEGKADSRVKLMRAVRAACRAQGMDDDDRRALQLELVKKASMKDMTPAELGKMLDHLNRGRTRPESSRPHLSKIKALWWTLYWIGAVEQPNDRAIDAFVSRVSKVSALRFLDAGSSRAVIEALKSWAAREGVNWPDAAQAEAIGANHPRLTMAQLERHAVLALIERKLHDAGVLHGRYIDYLRTALDLGPRHFDWTDRQLDDGIRLLGKRLRSEIAKGKVR